MPASVLPAALFVCYSKLAYTYNTLSAGQRLAVGLVQSVQLITYTAIKTNILEGTTVRSQAKGGKKTKSAYPLCKS